MKPVLPAVGICGWSGCGKTALVGGLVRRLQARGLRVGVIKHDVHGVTHQAGGKDSDCFFQAGADAVVLGPGEVWQRLHAGQGRSLPELISELDARCDVVLCEGFKTAGFAVKIWLRKVPSEQPPEDVGCVSRLLDPGEDRTAIVEGMIGEWMKARVDSTPVYGGVLIGGASRRMGRPKHLLQLDGQTWVERIVGAVGQWARRVVLLGAGKVPAALGALPVLPDVENRQGPLAGMLAAMRWHPEAAWLFAACDQPSLSAAALDWILGLRRPGVWAVLPRNPETQALEPLFALYEPRARGLLEYVMAPSDLAGSPAVITPEIPAGLRRSWTDADTTKEALQNGWLRRSQRSRAAITRRTKAGSQGPGSL